MSLVVLPGVRSEVAELLRRVAGHYGTYEGFCSPNKDHGNRQEYDWTQHARAVANSVCMRLGSFCISWNENHPPGAMALRAHRHRGVSVSLCLCVSVSPCPRVPVSPCLRVSVSPCLRVLCE
eukprot:124522-Rhodomonas_salina.2